MHQLTESTTEKRQLLLRVKTMEIHKTVNVSDLKLDKCSLLILILKILNQISIKYDRINLRHDQTIIQAMCTEGTKPIQGKPFTCILSLYPCVCVCQLTLGLYRLDFYLTLKNVFEIQTRAKIHKLKMIEKYFTRANNPNNSTAAV